MSSASTILKSIQASVQGLPIAELLARHPDVPRRTVQRWIQALIRKGQVRAEGNARARRYLAVARQAIAADDTQDVFPDFIPLSPDSRDILAYVDRPLEMRRPVGYQRAFLDALPDCETVSTVSKKSPRHSPGGLFVDAYGFTLYLLPQPAKYVGAAVGALSQYIRVANVSGP